VTSARKIDSTAKHDPAPRPRPDVPANVKPQGLLGLQSTAGNAAVVQMLRLIGHPGAQDRCQDTTSSHDTAGPDVQRSTTHDILRQPGRPMTDATRSEMESRLGADLSDVRLHDDHAARQSADELGATAYTSGNHVVIGEHGGDKHTLAHELTHVIQQRQGPVAGTDNGAGLRVSDPTDPFEREAETNARTVMNRPVPAPPPDVHPHEGGPSARITDETHPVQRMQTAPPADLTNWATDQEGRAAEAFALLKEGTFWKEFTLGGRDLIADLSTQNVTNLNEEIRSGNEEPGAETAWQDRVGREVRTALEGCVLRHYTTLAQAKEVLEKDDGELKSTGKFSADGDTQGRNNSEGDTEDLANHGFVFFFIEPKDQQARDTRFSKEPGRRPARIELPLDDLIANGWIMLTDFKDQDFPAIRANKAGDLYSYKNGTSVEDRLRMARMDLGDPYLSDGIPTFLAEILKGIPEDLSETEWEKQWSSFDDKQMKDIVRYIKTILLRREEDKKLRPELRKRRDYDIQVRRFEGNYEGGGAMDYMTVSASKDGSEGEAKRAKDADLIKTYKEHLSGNVLAGPHIIPGLVARCLIEISRIDRQEGQGGLATTMKNMNGAELVSMLLKDFLRPQAMLPWSVVVNEGQVEPLPF
jgi:uncharacterized protein DUF4157